MVQIVTVIKDVKVAREGAVDVNELKEAVREWLKKYDYNEDEKFFTSKTVDGRINTLFEWDCDRKVDDYNKFHIIVDINIADAEEGEAEGKRALKGATTVKLKGRIERDYDEKWVKSPKRKFLRAIYDKYIREEKKKDLEGDLKKDVRALADELKIYFGS